jgi:type IV pilus assembly protein PilB
MGKFDIDDILQDLGVSDPNAAPTRPRRGRPADDDDGHRPKHSLDRAEQVFSPLPAVPSGQRSFAESVTVDNDPAVPVRPADVPPTSVGDALAPVYQPEDALAAKADVQDIGDFLVTVEAITQAQLANAQQVLKSSPGRQLTDILLEQGADEGKIYRAVAAHADVGFERVDLTPGATNGFDAKLLQRLSPDFCKSYCILPLRVAKSGAGPNALSRVIVASSSPDDVFLLDEVRRRLGVPHVKLVVAPPSDIRAALESVVGSEEKPQDIDVSSLLSEVAEDDVQVEKVTESQDHDLQAQAAESPVIRYVNYIIQNAVNEGASDIHVEPGDKKLKVRFRIDGVLHEMMNPPGAMAAAITSRLKIMANLDISERRLPQDGRIRCTVHGRKLDLRVSTIPSGAGYEKTVMRILDTKSINVELENLGFSEESLVIWKKAIDEPHGIVLVTGPTGSGKTTTLYASLRQMDKQTMNVSTVEDPIEYHLEGITQTQTHEKIGMTFAKALKALLRQDPDVIMLGEIRDLETAHTAVQAALTGHLVLSTLHTNDAPSSLTRLVNIGLEPFLVGAAVRAVLAQRLVRRLCVHCKAQETPSDEMREFLELQGLPVDIISVAKGCERCRRTGFSGRVGIYEVLAVDDQLRDIIARNPNVAEFRRIVLGRGMISLRQDGMLKVTKGLTTVEEIMRATESGV